MSITLAVIETDSNVSVTTLLSETLNNCGKLLKRKEKIHDINNLTEQYEAELKESGISKNQFIKSLQIIRKKEGLSFNGAIELSVFEENVDELESEIKELSELVEKGTNEIRKLGEK